MKRLVAFTMRFLNEILGTEIPGDFLNERLSGFNTIKKVVMSGIFHRVVRPHLRMFFYTTLLDTPFDFLKIFARRCFPGIGEIRLRYGLDIKSKKVYAYYFLNPILILKRKPWS